MPIETARAAIGVPHTSCAAHRPLGHGLEDFPVFLRAPESGKAVSWPYLVDADDKVGAQTLVARRLAQHTDHRLGTRPAPAPASVAGPPRWAMPSTRIAFSPRLSFSRPSVEPTSSPESSRTRSSR